MKMEEGASLSPIIVDAPPGIQPFYVVGILLGVILLALIIEYTPWRMWSRILVVPVVLGVGFCGYLSSSWYGSVNDQLFKSYPLEERYGLTHMDIPLPSFLDGIKSTVPVAIQIADPSSEQESTRGKLIQVERDAETGTFSTPVPLQERVAMPNLHLLIDGRVFEVAVMLPDGTFEPFS